MRVLGVDPGTRVVGYGIVEVGERGRQAGRDGARVPIADTRRIRNQVSVRLASNVNVLDAGCIMLGRASVDRRLLQLGEALEQALAHWRPDVLAVEQAFYGKSVQSALRLGESRGVVLLCAARAGVDVAQYPPATVKLRVAGAGSASKQAVAKMVAAGVGSTLAELPVDATDALALALCHIHSIPNTGY